MSADAALQVLGGGRVVLSDRVLDPGWLQITGGSIVALGGGAPPWAATVDLSGLLVVPGFVDIHVHGGAGASFQTGTGDAAASIAAFHRRHGTTTLLASLVTAPLGDLQRSVAVLADLVTDGLLAGVHLEGPWLSPGQCGAHDSALLLPPDDVALKRLLHLRPGVVQMVTLAPELPGGEAAVRAIVEAGVVAAVGHTDARYDQTRAALTAGARVGTHLFNAMRPVHHREPGPIIALLEDPRVTVELILDGVHVHPAVVRHVVTTVGPDRVALVTDAMAAAGVGDGNYHLGGLAVTVTGGVARLDQSGAIAGSTLTADVAFRRAVLDCGLPLHAAARIAATTPARTLGLQDRGTLQVGARADLAVLDGDLHVVAVMSNGAWVSH